MNVLRLILMHNYNEKLWVCMIYITKFQCKNYHQANVTFKLKKFGSPHQNSF